jgi:RNA polymerase sigma factor (sigma-70 family)
MNAYRAFQRGTRPIKPHNWLIKIAHNNARTRYARMNGRAREVPLDAYIERLEVPDGEKPDLRAVLEALRKLPFNQRAALVMRELEGRTYAEIADTLGASVAAVETLIFRARRSLRVRAAELRVLGAVPLPGSLSQLFGGGAVAGGGALIGSGVLLKVTVAIVAGVVATGVGGDRTRDAAASPAAHRAAPVAPRQTLERARAHPARAHLAAAPTIALRRKSGAAVDAVRAARKSLPAEDAVASSGGDAQGTNGGHAKDANGGEAQAANGGERPTPASSGGSVQNVTEPASTAVQDVQNALPVSTPAAPVTVPQLPSPPVEVPQPPSIPVPTLP